MKHLVLAALMVALHANAAPKISPFSLPQMNHTDVGSMYNSADQKNAVFVVEAYFLGCPYCNDNAPYVNDLQDKYASEPRVQILDVGIDKKDSDYATWIRKHEPNHPVLKDANRVLIRQLGTTGYPSSYVIDCQGNVLYKTSGVWNSGKIKNIEAAIEKGLSTTCVVLDDPAQN